MAPKRRDPKSRVRRKCRYPGCENWFKVFPKMLTDEPMCYLHKPSRKDPNKSETGLQTFTCEECGKQFARVAYRAANRFCSQECSDKGRYYDQRDKV